MHLPHRCPPAIHHPRLRRDRGTRRGRRGRTRSPRRADGPRWGICIVGGDVTVTAAATRAAVPTRSGGLGVSGSGPSRRGEPPQRATAAGSAGRGPVSYTHLTLPTKRIV